MENKFILRVQFGTGDNVSYSHYVLDLKYYRDILSKSDLKEIPEIVISEEAFKQINAITCFNIHNDVEV